jgi:hypothetical protein
MKIFFDVKGLHFQPETPEEQDAIRILWNNAKHTKSPIGSTPSLSKEIVPRIVGNQ